MELLIKEGVGFRGRMKRTGQGEEVYVVQCRVIGDVYTKGFKKRVMHPLFSILWRTFSSHLSGPSSVSQANQPSPSMQVLLGTLLGPFPSHTMHCP